MTSTLTSDAVVRVTLHPGEDLLLRPGVRLGDLRAPLAALTRRPELRYAALAVDGGDNGADDVAPGDDLLVGERPLLPGAIVRTLPPTGPGGAGGAVGAVGTDLAGGAGAARWRIVRVTGADAGTVVDVGGPISAVRAWARLRGGGRLTLRRACTPAEQLLPSRKPSAGGTSLALAIVPAVASLSLAAALRQPLLAVFALVGLVAAVPQLRRASRSAGLQGTTRSRSSDLPGPARFQAFAEAAHRVSPGAWAAARAANTGTRSDDGRRLGTEPPPLAPHDHWDTLLRDGSVAVLGPVHHARSVARALVAGLATYGAAVRVIGCTTGWSWVRWLPAGGPPVLVVDEGRGRAPERTSERGADGGLVVAVGTVPRGCRTVIRVLDGHRVQITGPDGGRRVTRLVGVTPAWAEHLARLLTGAARLGRTATTLHGAGQAESIVLPAVVSLTGVHDLAAPPPSDEIAARWAGARGWAVPLGTGAARTTVHLDLVRDGPHLLVAGTTGSGKSELLQALVLGLALTRSPADLAIVLVDFKGGASFGACPGLPHVVGRVTDLEQGLAARALGGLRAELRRRELVLAEHGVPDISALATGTLPRLVVVIDEFRALADDLPEFLPALLRVAAQGRSLGVHLVLATQRPGGAVGPDLRANVSARIALRVTDPLDSRDVIEDPAAAHLSSATPGRALLRIGSAAPVLLQCARAAASPVARPPLVERAPAWPPRARSSAPEHSDAPDASLLLVEAASQAARSLGHVAGAPPWLPQLPRHVTAADLPPTALRPAGHLVLALGDDPDRQRRTALSWDPNDGHLAILGRARSGRTTALVTLGLAALRKGWTVHGIARHAAGLDLLAHHPGYGTTVHPDDLTALSSLLSEVTSATGCAPSGRTLLLVDGAEDVRGTLGSAALTSAALGPGVALALTADGPSAGGLSARVGQRLVLLGTDRATDVVLGAPASFAGTGGPPGRGVWCGRDQPVLCQVLAPEDLAAADDPAAPSASVLRSGLRGRCDDGRRQEQHTHRHADHEHDPATGNRES